MTEKKITILTLSDHPLSPSGVGTQTKYMIEAMLKTGKYRFICLGGAVKHENSQPVKIEPYLDDWVVFPVDGYGTPDMLRSFLANFKPDIIWFMTDPRFWGWLWEMENEVRSVAPMVYYHVWDNKPYPMFNKTWYDSNDVIATISKVTSDVVKNVSPEVEEVYLPHAVNTDIFKKISEQEVKDTKLRTLGEDGDKLIFFWNSRNARRKQSGSVIWWFKEYLDVVGHDKARLIMHTDPKDPHGQDLVAVLSAVGLTNGEVVLSKDKLPPSQLAVMYNMADCTIGISDAEGFGLSTFESLACETPIIVNMTGGLQEQVTDGQNWFGIGIEPCSKAVIGSQEVPYIYEDRISKNDFVDALVKITEMSKEERQKLGTMGRQHLIKNYNLDNFAKQWDELFTRIHNNCGSWDTRKNYKSWEFSEVL